MVRLPPNGVIPKERPADVVEAGALGAGRLPKEESPWAGVAAGCAGDIPNPKPEAGLGAVVAGVENSDDFPSAAADAPKLKPPPA